MKTNKKNLKSKKKTSWSFKSFKTNWTKMTIKNAIPQYQLNEETQYELENIKEIHKTVNVWRYIGIEIVLGSFKIWYLY